MQPEKLIYYEDDSQNPKLVKRYNLEDPDLDERIRLYLKPTDANPALLLLLLLVDAIAGIIFVCFQVEYIIDSVFNIQSNKAMLVIIAWGITGVVLTYTILDS